MCGRRVPGRRGKSTRKGGEARLHPGGTPAGVGAGTWQREASARQVAVALGQGKFLDPVSKLPGSAGPKVPTASLFLLPLRTGLADPLSWSSRSDRPFEYEHLPSSPGAGALASAFLVYIHIRAAHSQV